MCERKTYRRYDRKLRPTGGFANSSTDGWNCPSNLLNSEAQRTGFRIDQNPRKRYSQVIGLYDGFEVEFISKSD